jgi:hypothetical protein
MASYFPTTSSTAANSFYYYPSTGFPQTSALLMLYFQNYQSVPTSEPQSDLHHSSSSIDNGSIQLPPSYSSVTSTSEYFRNNKPREKSNSLDTLNSFKVPTEYHGEYYSYRLPEEDRKYKRRSSLRTLPGHLSDSETERDEETGRLLHDSKTSFHSQNVLLPEIFPASSSNKKENNQPKTNDLTSKYKTMRRSNQSEPLMDRTNNRFILKRIKNKLSNIFKR